MDSQRLIAVGEGKDKFGHAFMFDTAASVGSIINLYILTLDRRSIGSF